MDGGMRDGTKAVHRARTCRDYFPFRDAPASSIEEGWLGEFLSSKHRLRSS